MLIRLPMISLFLALSPLLAPPQTSTPCETDRIGHSGGFSGDLAGSRVAAGGSHILSSAAGMSSTGSFQRGLQLDFFFGGKWISVFGSFGGSGSSLDPFLIDTDGLITAYVNPQVFTVHLSLNSDLLAQEFQFLPIPPLSNNHFVRDIEIAGDRVFVLYDVSSSSTFGARLLEYSIPNLSLLSTTAVGPDSVIGLQGPNGAGIDESGGELAFSNGRLLVGLPGDDTAGVNAGSVHVFDVSAGNPVEIQQIFPSPALPYGAFGSDLEADATRAIIAARGTTQPISVGERAFVYRSDASGFSFEAELDLGATDGSTGISADLEGPVAAIGLPGTENLTLPAPGQVRTFRLDASATWAPDVTFQAFIPQPGDRFGADVAFLNTDRLVVGMPRDPAQLDERGVASVFSLSGNDCASTLMAPNDRWFTGAFPLNIDLALNGGMDLAGDLAVCMASTTAPGAGLLLDGIPIPIAPDALTFAGLNAPGSLGFNNFFTNLDANGRSEAPNVFLTNVPSGLFGTELWFTWISLEIEPANVFVQFAGEARGLTLL